MTVKVEIKVELEGDDGTDLRAARLLAALAKLVKCEEGE